MPRRRKRETTYWAIWQHGQPHCPVCQGRLGWMEHYKPLPDTAAGYVGYYHCRQCRQRVAIAVNRLLEYLIPPPVVKGIRPYAHPPT